MLDKDKGDSVSSVGRSLGEEIPGDVVEPLKDSEDDGRDSMGLCDFIQKDIISGEEFVGPFGVRKGIYCDYTASGKPLKSIEEFIRKEVLPLYGNTHSSVTVTSEQSTLFFHEARDEIRNATCAGEKDVVLFCGSGTTSAVHVLLHALSLDKSPLVVLGPFEHHSNILPWVEIASQVERVKEDVHGSLDMNHLNAILERYSIVSKEEGRQIIGCFSAASNVTGVVTDTVSVTQLCHKHGALAFWDYATGAPYMEIKMNPISDSAPEGAAWKDAVFFSGHKFPGGTQSPGVLIAKKALFKNRSPLKSGGGSIFFVRREHHTYLKEIEYREEGGTPDIVGAIRLALALRLKNSLSTKFISDKDRTIVKKVHNRLKECGNVVLLGPVSQEKLPIFSFLIRHPESGLFLHHNFVCALLDNLFGIQSRSGCACAGPYAMDLMGMDEKLAATYESLLQEDPRFDRDHLRRHREYSSYESLRPGFVRINIPYFMPDEEMEFVLSAVKFVAEHGWKFLPRYRLNPESGEWHHLKKTVFKERKWLGQTSFSGKGLQYRVPQIPNSAPTSFAKCLSEANRVLQSEMEQTKSSNVPKQSHLFRDNETARPLAWFLTSDEAQNILQDLPHLNHYPQPPFSPIQYNEIPIINGHGDSEPGDMKIRNSVMEHEVEATMSAPQIEPQIRNESVKALLKDNPDLDIGLLVEKTIQRKIKDSSKTTQLPSSDNTLERSDPSCSSEVGCPLKQDWNQCEFIVAQPKKEKLRFKWHHPSPEIFKPALQALEDFEMIGDGDRVLVCLSGGKDSLSLLHLLHQYQFYAASKSVRFELGAITVDPGSQAYDPSPLIDYLTGLNLTYLYERQNILEQAMSLENCESICSFCSRMKRGRLYAGARRHGFNVLAFGQHLDDLAESFLMSSFHNGILSTMKANYTVKEGDLRVIRPLAYVREKDLRKFAETKRLPIIPENCPACFEAPKERHRMKQLLASQEVLFPDLFHHLCRSLKPLMKGTLSTNSPQSLTSDDDESIN